MNGSCMNMVVGGVFIRYSAWKVIFVSSASYSYGGKIVRGGYGN